MSLIMREMQIKTTRYHLTPIRMAINKSTNNKHWWRCGERGTLLQCWWDCRLVQPLWKAVWRELKKLKMDLLFDPAIPLPGIYLKEPTTLIWKNIRNPVFISELFTITKTWKQLTCSSIDEWIKEIWNIYIMQYYSAIKKKTILPFETVWMGLENIMLSEITQSEKDRHYTVSLKCNLMNKLN